MGKQKIMRLMILKILAKNAGYLNIYTLQGCLAAVAHEVSLDRLKTDLAWLREQGLISLGEIGKVCIAKITVHGNAVASGRTVVPGVKRPEPEM